MCLYDIFSSLPIALRPFKVIPDDATIDALLAFGNQTSCNILTFIQIIGVVGTPMYSVSLNMYYLYLIKYNMRERTFRRKIEPYVHGIPAVWTLSGAIFALVSQMYNPGKLDTNIYTSDERQISDSTSLHLNCIRKVLPADVLWLQNLLVVKRMMISNVKMAKMLHGSFLSLQQFP